LCVDHQISSLLYSTFVNLRYRDESKWNISITIHSLSFSPSLSLSLSLSIYIYIHTQTHTHTYVYVCMYMHAKLLQLCLAHCDPKDCSPPVSSVHGILWARRLEWVASSPPGESSQPRDRTHDSCISCNSRWILYR